MPSDLPSTVLARPLADLVIKGLRTSPAVDPSSKSPCVVLLPPSIDHFSMAVIKISEERGNKSLISILRSNYGDVLDAYASFANSIWTDDEISKYESCKCKGHDTEDIKRGYMQLEEARGPGRTPLQEIIVQVFTILDNVPPDMPNNSPNTIKLEKKGGKRRKWPSSPSQFIPQGGSTAVSAFVRWAKLAKNIAPISMLFRLTGYCPSLVPAMDKEIMLLPLVLDLLVRLANTIREVDPRNLNLRRLEFINEETMRFCHIFMSAWLKGRLQAPDGVFMRSNMQTLSAIYNTTCDLMPLLEAFDFSDLDQQRINVAFLFVGIQIHDFARSTSTPISLHPSLVLAVLKFENPGITRFSFGKLMGDALSLQSQRKCTEVSCVQTGEAARTNYKFCGACKMVRYCSKECQSSDWKEHKKVCKALKMFLLMPKHYTSLDTSPNELIKMKPCLLDEKLRQLSGLTEEEIRLADKYVNGRTLTTQPMNRLQPATGARPGHISLPFIIQGLDATFNGSNIPRNVLQ